MIIDGHAHMGGEYGSLPTIVKALDNAGVDKVVLCPADHRRDESIRIPDIAGRLHDKDLNFIVNKLIRLAANRATLGKNLDSGNEEIFNISCLSKGRVIQFFWADPGENNIIEKLEDKYLSWKFHGIKLHQACHPFQTDSVRFRDIIEFCVRANIPIFIHLYSKKEVMDFISVSKKYDAIFIVGHLIGLEILVKVKERIRGNIFFDISCPPLVSQDRVKLAINNFGPERIIMGSDTPYGINNIKKVIEGIRSLKLSDRERELILGDNLKNILGI